MKRDTELAREILLAMEDQYKPRQVSMWGVKVDGYNTETIAEHCRLLSQQGLISDFEAGVAGGHVVRYRAGKITSQRYDYVELIRNDNVWNKTKGEIKENKLAETFEEIARIAGIFTGNFYGEISK